jgi:peroxiredoxin
VVFASITGDQPQLLDNWAKSNGIRYGKILSDQGLQVSKMYDMLGADVSMMPGTAPGHTFLLVNKAGIIVWRGDYGPYNMYVPNNEIIAQVRKSLGS